VSTYTKLFSSIVHSTVWREPNHVRLVWVTMLAIADKDGEVGASIPGLADVARVSIEECEDAIAVLSSPDPYSRTPDYEGRRIEATAGGWTLLNHGQYRDRASAEERRVKDAERKRRTRARQKPKENQGGSAGRPATVRTRPHASEKVRDVTTPDQIRPDQIREQLHKHKSARAREEPPLPEPPDEADPHPADLPTFAFARKLFAERFEAATRTPWAHARYDAQVREVAAWAEAVASQHRIAPGVVVAQILDGFFADAWAQANTYPFGALAKRPAHYAKLGERGAA
jgi:hypothetical protein